MTNKYRFFAYFDFLCDEPLKQDTVKQDIFADTLFSRLGDFAVSRILIFADAGTELVICCHIDLNDVSLLECLLRDFIFHKLTNFMKFY